MTERERLAELIHKAQLLMWGKPVGDAKAQQEFIADYLLGHGEHLRIMRSSSTSTAPQSDAPHGMDGKTT